MVESRDVLIARIDTHLESINAHLKQINGRLDCVEDLSKLNDKAIAVIVAENKYVERAQVDAHQRIEKTQMRLDDRFYGFVKENGLQASSLIALIILIGQNLGWW